MKHVFLHTGWRSGGTWLWSRFRELPTVMGFYEPLHPVLDQGPDQLLTRRDDGWPSGHPHMESPYFAEYLHVLGHRWSHWRRVERVAGFKKGFALDSFQGGDPFMADRLQAYLRGLTDAAERQQRVAVMKFCRSMGRLDWMRRTFPDVCHVAVLRNPLSQYASMHTQLARYGNGGFFDQMAEVLMANRTEPRLQALMAHVDCRLPVTEPRQLPLSPVTTTRQRYQLFLVFWVMQSLSIALDEVLLVDIDELGLAGAQSLQARFVRDAGLNVDLSDVHQLAQARKVQPVEEWAGVHLSDMLDAHHGVRRFLQSSKMGVLPGQGQLIERKLQFAESLVSD